MIPTVHTHKLIAALLLLPLASPGAPSSPSGPTEWNDDFSDPNTLNVNWRPYGFLASGIDEKNPLGKAVGRKDARPEWWQVVDGALRGQCFPEEKHPPGLQRTIAGKDILLTLRFKLSEDGLMGIGVAGPNPVVERNFNVAGLHIRPGSVTAWDNDVLHPKDSPEAAELKKKGIWNRKFFYAKTQKCQIEPDVWHHLRVELRGKELRALIDEKIEITYTTLCGDVPKLDIGLQPGGKAKSAVVTWFDDIRVEPLPPVDSKGNDTGEQPAGAVR